MLRFVFFFLGGGLWLGFRISGSGFRVSGLGFQMYGLRVRHIWLMIFNQSIASVLVGVSLSGGTCRWSLSCLRPRTSVNPNPSTLKPTGQPFAV